MPDRSVTSTSSGALETLSCVTFGTPEFSQAKALYLKSFARFGCTRVEAFGVDSDAVAKARAAIKFWTSVNYFFAAPQAAVRGLPP